MLMDLAALAFVVLAVVLTLLVHEVGHLIGGQAGGLRFALLVVGPLHVQRQADGRIAWRLNRRLALAGGVAACLHEGGIDLRRAYRRMVAGGPLASVAFGVLALALLIRTVLSTPSGEGLFAHPASPGLFVAAAGSLGVGFGTLLPLAVGGFPNDGWRLLRLLRRGPAAEREAASMALSSGYLAGRRPRDWNPELVRTAVSLPDGSYSAAVGHSLAYLHALDRGDLDGAERHLRAQVALLDVVPEAYRPVIELEAAYFRWAYGRCEELELRRPEDVGTGPIVQEPLRQRAEAAVLLAEGEVQAATARLRSIYDEMARQPESDESVFVMAEIERLSRHWELPRPPAMDRSGGRGG